jgi:hypothetical protein
LATVNAPKGTKQYNKRPLQGGADDYQNVLLIWLSCGIGFYLSVRFVCIGCPFHWKHINWWYYGRKVCADMVLFSDYRKLRMDEK